MISLIVFLPLMSFVTILLLGRFIGLGSLYISITFVGLSSILSLINFYEAINDENIIKINLGLWLHVDSLAVNWSFYIDSLTSIMLVTVTSISTLVHIYSSDYMREDPHLNRFMAYLSLFTFFMLILVTANNLLQMFVGWEGVGVSSYLLISFWFTRIQANKSAIKAMVMNRIGDFFILISIFSLYVLLESIDYDLIFTLCREVRAESFQFNRIEIRSLDCISMLLFLGAMGKSAQLGLHTWLPDAMEGPTPVSALIHAATMVTAGVFLISRCSYLFELSDFSLNFILLIGSLTAFFASTTGLFQNDIKKIIAYSTCSQLGYMIIACGLSSYDVAIFHLFNHAFFKALLFLGAGSVIHSFATHEQDIRKMGGLINLLPLSYATISIGSLALIGFPFLTGFYSKDIILEAALSNYTSLAHFSYYVGCFGAFFTAFYSTRLLCLVFLTKPNSNKVCFDKMHETSGPIGFVIICLAIISVFIGFLSKDILIGAGTPFWGSSLFILPHNYKNLDFEFISSSYKFIPLFFVFSGCLISFTLYSYGLSHFFCVKNIKEIQFIYYFFNRKWYFDRLYNDIVSKNILFLGYHITYQTLDRGILEYVGPYSLSNNDLFLMKWMKNQHSGDVIQYIYFFILFTLLVLSFIMLFN